MSVTAHFLPGNGGLPGDSRQAGFEANHTIFYVARAVLEGGVHLGKFRADWHAAAIPYAGQERWVSNYEVWVGKLSPDNAGGVWDKANVNNAALVGGHEADGTPLYAARAWHEGGLHLGKWRADWTAASISYAGGEVWVGQFEVLSDGQYFEGDPAFGWQR